MGFDACLPESRRRVQGFLVKPDKKPPRMGAAVVVGRTTDALLDMVGWWSWDTLLQVFGICAKKIVITFSRPSVPVPAFGFLGLLLQGDLRRQLLFCAGTWCQRFGVCKTLGFAVCRCCVARWGLQCLTPKGMEHARSDFGVSGQGKD